MSLPLIWRRRLQPYQSSQNRAYLAREDSTSTQTITGKARIHNIVSKTQIGQANILATTTRTQTGVSRIQIVSTQTITGVAKIATPGFSGVGMQSFVLEIDQVSLGTTLELNGDMLAITPVTSAPSGAPENNVGMVFQISGGVLKVWVWDGTAWRSLA